jgi:hypothetical protein
MVRVLGQRSDGHLIRVGVWLRTSRRLVLTYIEEKVEVCFFFKLVLPGQAK